MEGTFAPIGRRAQKADNIMALIRKRRVKRVMDFHRGMCQALSHLAETDHPTMDWLADLISARLGEDGFLLMLRVLGAHV